MPTLYPGARRGDTVNQALALLVFVWAALLVPGAVRRSRTSPHATVGGFERAMDVLRSEPRRTGGRELFVPRDAGQIVQWGPGHGAGPDAHPDGDAVVARRREWFLRSLMAVGVSFVAAIAIGGSAWALFGIVVVTTAGYVVVLRHHKLQRDHARRVVHALDLEGDVRVDDALPVAVGQGVAGSSVRLRRWNA